MTCRAGRWTLTESGLISVCSYCVQAGVIPAPPHWIRTDGICEEHLLVVRREIAEHRAAREQGVE